MSEVSSTVQGISTVSKTSQNAVEIGEDELKRLVATLRERMQGHKLTAEASGYIDDVILKQFILGKKGNIEKAFRAGLHGTHGLFGCFGDMLLTYDPIKLTILDSGSARLLKHKDTLGRPVVLFRLSHFDEKAATSLEAMVRQNSYIVQTILRFDETCCKLGMVGIYDAKGVRWGHLKLAKTFLSTSFNTGQELLALFLNSNPIRLKGLHLVNHSRVLNPFIALGKSLLPIKLKGRIYQHNNVGSLKDFFDPDILPKFLGGTLEEEESFDFTFEEKLAQNAEFFEEYKTMGRQLRSKFEGKHVGFDPQKCSGPGCGREMWQ